MDQNSKDKTIDSLTRSENILIVVSKQEGFDGQAAGLALYLSLAKLGKNVMVLAKEPTAGDAQRLYGIDKIGKTGSSQNPVIVIKDAVATVDKVSYFLDGDKLKVIIHPLPGSKGITRESMTLEYSAAQPNLIFSIGFTNQEALEKEIPHEHKTTPETWIINIGRLQMQQKFAQLELVNPQSTSISEATAIALQELALPLDEDIAYNLYEGISDSTEHFNPAKTTAKTFEIAAWLVKFGAGKASFAAAQASVKTQVPFAPTHRFTPATSRFSETSKPMPPFNPPDFYDEAAPIENIESLPETQSHEQDSKNWLKPPKIYKGSKSFSEGKE